MDKAQIRVAVAGAAGRMGRLVVATVLQAEDISLEVAVDTHQVGEDAGAVAGVSPCGLSIQNELRTALDARPCDVVVDFTVAEAAQKHALLAIELGVRPIIGTSGLGTDTLHSLDAHLRARGMGGLVVPNFAIGAVLMMKFAAEAAKHLPHVEIVELHHDRKADAPSGTAIRTAEAISDTVQAPLVAAETKHSILEGARGAEMSGIRIHSVRLPGLLAHQEVLLSGEGQLLTIRHDTFDRKSFMPGVLLAIRRVSEITGLVIGLDSLL